ncbi:MAG: hypothetical protein U5L46_02335 [Agrobacterium sp.]|nr:hypothetical protein [Agrobacterium sp.]
MAVTLLSPFRSSIAAVAALIALCGWGSLLGTACGAGVAPYGPEFIADFAAPLLDAVVNISTSQNVKTDGKGPVPPKLPEGSLGIRIISTIL